MTLEEQLKKEILSKYKSIRAFTTAINIPYSTLDSVFKRGITNAGVTTMIKVFGALDLDVESISTGKLEGKIPMHSHLTFVFTAQEQGHIQKYRLLDPYGKEAVDGVLDVEWRRCTAAEETTRRAQASEDEKIIRFSVPGYSLPMSAGTGQEAGQEYPENYTLVKEPPRGTSFIARVSGDSMEPTYYNDDLVFVHSTEEIPVGRIGVFFMDGQQWVKELGDGMLLSHNPAYPPRPMTEDIRCQGLVLGVCDESYFD